MTIDLPAIPRRISMRAVILERRGGAWAVGTGLIAIGMIDRDLAMHSTEALAEAAALVLADARDLIAVRT